MSSTSNASVPETLAALSSFEGARDINARWYVLHTLSRQEKWVANDLSARGVQIYLPMQKLVRVYGGRRQSNDLPLFPGYVFLCGSLDEVYDADRTKRVANVIHVSDQPRLIRELASVRTIIEQRLRLEPYPFLQKGIYVEVRSGPLRGVRGIIESRASAHRLIVQVELLGRAVSTEIDAQLLDAVDDVSWGTGGGRVA